MNVKETIFNILKHIKIKHEHNLHNQTPYENTMQSQYENTMKKYNRFDYRR